MGKNLFVAGLDYSVIDSELEELFAQQGTVVSAKVIMDRETDRSKGFGFVEMSSVEEAENCIKNLDGIDFQGRTLMVKEARPKGEMSGGGGGGRFGPNKSSGGGRFGNDKKGRGNDRFNKRDNNRRDW